MNGISMSPGLLPLYQQIYEDIRHKIDSGKLQPGDRIRSEVDLIKDYQVSRITVRRALSKLTADGYLYKKQGIGTFVGKPRVRRVISSIDSFSESCKTLGLVPSYRLNKLLIVPTRSDEQTFLKLDDNTKLIYSSRILFADGVPVMQENCFFPHTSKFDWVLETSLEQPLYPLLKQHDVLPRSTAKRTLEIAIASPEMATMMKMPAAAPMFYKNDYLLDEKKEPLFIERSFMVGTRYVFDITCDLPPNPCTSPRVS